MNKGYLLSLAAAFLFGLSTPVTKLLLNSINPVLLAGLFYLGAALFLLPFSCKDFLKELRHLLLHRHDMLRLSGAIFFGGIVGPILLMLGIDKMNAANASLLLNLETVATFFWGWLVFKEHVSKKIIVASILIIVSGGLLTVRNDLTFNLGAILIVLACVAWGLDNNLTAMIEGVGAKTSTILKGSFAAIVNISMSFTVYGYIAISWKTVLISVITGGIAYGLSIVLYIYAARIIGAIRSQLVFSFNPLLGMLLSFVVYNELFLESFNFQFIVAVVLMVASLFFLNNEKHRHEHVHDEIEHSHVHRHNDEHHGHTHLDATDLVTHNHRHKHSRIVHVHDHFPDIHHRHTHS